MRYLLDSNILSELVRPRPQPVVMAAVREHWPVCVTSSIVYLELWSGVERLGKTMRRAYLRDGYEQMFRGGLEVLPFDAEAAHWLAVERSRLEQVGRPPPLLDAQIAATAVTRNLTLITRNTRDFECFNGLSLEDWFMETAG
jgi:tRNA(fMet)-specific endonuclease VapC